MQGSFGGGLASLEIDHSDLDMFITHMHGDHSGLVYELASKDHQARVYISEIDAGLLRDTFTMDNWQRIDANFRAHGFPNQAKTNSQSRRYQVLHLRHRAEFHLR